MQFLLKSAHEQMHSSPELSRHLILELFTLACAASLRLPQRLLQRLCRNFLHGRHGMVAAAQSQWHRELMFHKRAQVYPTPEGEGGGKYQLLEKREEEEFYQRS